jgi:hypothetical protein
MSGWGCRHQVDDRCLLLRKECKPGIRGCVLHGKVRFISEVERDAAEKVAKKKAKKAKKKIARPRPRRSS